MNKLYTLLAITLLALAQTVAFAQTERYIKGVVNDTETNTPLPGVVVEIVGSNTGTVTDENGAFSINTYRPFPFTLRISSVGYLPQEFVLTDSTSGPFAVALVTDNRDNEVTVTARRRAETAQDVPIPITVIGGGLVEQTGAFNVNRVKELVPSVQLYSSNPRNTALNIRGLGSPFGLTNDGIDPGVGFYVDGVYYARPAAATLDFIDIERIEVLRGPQGTLFGKNTTSGAFNISTRRPSFKPGAAFEASYGNYNYVQAKVSVTGPIIADKLAVRLSFSGTQRGGNIYNTRTDRYTNSLDNLGGRAQFLFKASERVNILVAGDITRQRPDGYAQTLGGVVKTNRVNQRQFDTIIAALNYEPVSRDPFDRKIDHDTPWKSNNDLGGASVNVDAKIGPGTLTSTTAWRYWNWTPSNDRDFTGLSIVRRSEGNSRQDQYSQEVRYAGDISKRVSGVVGVYAIYQEIKTPPVQTEEAGSDAWRYYQDSFTPAATANWSTPGLLDGFGIQTKSSLKTFSGAVFANVDVAVTEKFHVLPGLRFNIDHKDVNYNRTTYGGLQSPTPAQQAIKDKVYQNQAYTASVDNNNLSGQLTLSYKLAKNINTYASASTAYKPVGANVAGIPNGTNAIDYGIVKPEYVNHFEAGIKTKPTQNSTINFTAFDTEVKDFQTQVQSAEPGANRGYLANAEHVRVFGAELDANVRFQYLSVYGALAYTDGKYEKFTNAPLPLEETGSTVTYKDISGGDLPGISKWAGSLGAEVSTPKTTFLGFDGSFFLGLDSYYRSKFSSSPSPSKYLNVQEYAIVNGRLGFRSSDNVFSAFIWARNITDFHYFEQLLPATGNAGHYAAVLGDPRTYGVTLRANFGSATNNR
ncbi:MAG: TonB-dependent receptor [Cytophagaceae bacterium]|jgi:iron complex outermembrane receptor protein|nr:TonB-dependent receptor [Cytophagaceae bacterium]